MRRFAMFLEHARPPELQLTSGSVWHVYTDACYEPSHEFWKCGLGGVLVNPWGVPVAFFSTSLDQQQMNLLGAGVKKTQNL